MSKSVLNKIRKLITQMNPDELRMIFEILQSVLNRTQPKPIEEVCKSKFAEGLRCPHCKEKSVIKFGKYNDVHRSLCKWEDFIQCMVDKFSLRIRPATV